MGNAGTGLQIMWLTIVVIVGFTSVVSTLQRILAQLRAPQEPRTADE